MNYGDYLTTSEMTRWILDTDIAWDEIDAAGAGAAGHPGPHAGLGADRVLLPDLHATRARFAMEDVTSTAVFSVQLYESYKHFHVSRSSSMRSATGQSRMRRSSRSGAKNVDLKFDHPSRLLTRYMMSEHFAAHSFFKDSRRSAELVLAHILSLVAKGWRCGIASSATVLLAQRLAKHPEEIDAVIDEAAHSSTSASWSCRTCRWRRRTTSPRSWRSTARSARLTGRPIASSLAEVLA